MAGSVSPFDLVPAPYRWLAIAGVVLAALGTAFVKGALWEKDRWDAADAKAQAAQLAEVQRLAKLGARVETQYVDRIRTVTKVVRDAERKADAVPARCELAVDWTGVWNYAAAGLVAEPAPGLDGSAAGAGIVTQR